MVGRPVNLIKPMNTKILLLALLSLMIGFTACDKTDDELPVSIPKIKTITFHNGSTTISATYEYDQQGRVIRITSEDSFIQYEYHSDKIIKNESRNDSFTASSLLLNDKGLVIALLMDNYIYMTYEYTLDGFHDKSTSYFMGSIPDWVTDNTIADGNRISCVVWEQDMYEPNRDDDLESTYTYEYEYLASSTNTIGHENMGIDFFGKQDKNLVSKMTLYRNNVEHVTNYIYKLDAHKRVVKVWEDNRPENVYKTYTYY